MTRGTRFTELKRMSGSILMGDRLFFCTRENFGVKALLEPVQALVFIG